MQIECDRPHGRAPSELFVTLGPTVDGDLMSSARWSTEWTSRVHVIITGLVTVSNPSARGLLCQVER